MADSEGDATRGSAVDEVLKVLADEGVGVTVDGDVVVLDDPPKGDAGIAVLRVIGLAQHLHDFGVLARNPATVAVGVWKGPELYLTRWTTAGRRIVGYRVSTGHGSRIVDYLRTEGRLPTHLETGNWYAKDAVPEHVAEAFAGIDIDLDDPPFPVIAPAPTPRPAPSPTRPATTKKVGAPRPTAAPRARATQKAPSPAKKVAPAMQVCPGCGLLRPPVQFVAGSDLCVDCR